MRSAMNSNRLSGNEEVERINGRVRSERVKE